jgi:hypothetical protein
MCLTSGGVFRHWKAAAITSISRAESVLLGGMVQLIEYGILWLKIRKEGWLEKKWSRRDKRGIWRMDAKEKRD